MEHAHAIPPGRIVHPEKLLDFLFGDEQYPGSSIDAVWLPDDFVELWRMLLQCKLREAFIAGTPAESLTGVLEQFERLRQPRIATVADLLHDSSTPLALIRLANALAKHDVEGRPGGLPREIARGFYCATAIAARVRHGVDVADVPPAELREWVQQLSRQGWLDEHTFELTLRFLGRP